MRDVSLSGSICLLGYWGIVRASVHHLCSDQSLAGDLFFPGVHKLVLHSCLSCAKRAGAQREELEATPPSLPFLRRTGVSGGRFSPSGLSRTPPVIPWLLPRYHTAVA